MIDIIPILNAVLALVFVLCLIWLCAYAARRYAPRNFLVGKGRRLQLIETMPIDARHRAILLRCDAHEHLLIVGDGKSCVVARDIPTPPVPKDIVS